jgi:hypothetical protein
MVILVFLPVSGRLRPSSSAAPACKCATYLAIAESIPTNHGEVSVERSFPCAHILRAISGTDLSGCRSIAFFATTSLPQAFATAIVDGTFQPRRTSSRRYLRITANSLNGSGVSRTPIREALLRLGSRGLVRWRFREGSNHGPAADRHPESGGEAPATSSLRCTRGSFERSPAKLGCRSTGSNEGSEPTLREGGRLRRTVEGAFDGWMSEFHRNPRCDARQTAPSSRDARPVRIHLCDARNVSASARTATPQSKCTISGSYELFEERVREAGPGLDSQPSTFWHSHPIESKTLRRRTKRSDPTSYRRVVPFGSSDSCPRHRCELSWRVREGVATTGGAGLGSFTETGLMRREAYPWPSVRRRRPSRHRTGKPCSWWQVALGGVQAPHIWRDGQKMCSLAQRAG